MFFKLWEGVGASSYACCPFLCSIAVLSNNLLPSYRWKAQSGFAGKRQAVEKKTRGSARVTLSHRAVEPLVLVKSPANNLFSLLFCFFVVFVLRGQRPAQKVNQKHSGWMREGNSMCWRYSRSLSSRSTSSCLVPVCLSPRCLSSALSSLVGHPDKSAPSSKV